MNRIRSNEIIIIATIVALIGCVPKDLPPDLKPAYTANEILIRVHELQQLTIGLHDSGIVTKERADLIVRFTVLAADVIKNSISGWEQTIKSAWKQLNQLILKPETELDSIWTMMDWLIKGL
jgi:hypothetical protein